MGLGFRAEVNAMAASIDSGGRSDAAAGQVIWWCLRGADELDETEVGGRPRE